jgi:hypothetical protein
MRKIDLPSKPMDSALLVGRAGFLSAVKLSDMKREEARGVVSEAPPRNATTQFGVVRLRTFRRKSHTGMRGTSATLGGSSPRHGAVGFSAYAKMLDMSAGKHLGRPLQVKIIRRSSDAIEVEMLQARGRGHAGERFSVSEEELHHLAVMGILEIVGGGDVGVSISYPGGS